MTPSPVAPFVSVVVPCLNEERHIADCLESILRNDYPADRLEILVVDGGSTDGTRSIIQSYVDERPNIRLVENPRRIIPAALNIGIKSARGDAICRMDAHCTYNTSHISDSITHLQASGADKVGGVYETRAGADSAAARAIAETLRHPFGIGRAAYRLPATAPVWADVVAFGTTWRDLYDRIGLYDERFERSEDAEFNERIRRSGGRILLVPSVICYYRARPDASSFARQSFQNGVWITKPLKFKPFMFRSRHAIPMAFVGALAVSAIVSFFWAPAVWAVLLLLGLYAVAAIGVGAQIAARRRDVAMLVLVPLMVATLHFAYGVGSFVGLAGLVRIRR